MGNTFIGPTTVQTDNITNSDNTGAPTLPFGVITSAPLLFAGGTAAAPSITFTGDTDTGLFRKAADSVGFSAGGIEVGSYDNTGAWTLGPAPVAATNGVLHRIATGDQGDLVSLTTAQAGYIQFGNGSVGAMAPTIGAVTSDINIPGLIISSAASDTNSVGDMLFGVRENDNSDFSTLTNNAFVFRRLSTDLVRITRAGAVTLGPSTVQNGVYQIANGSVNSRHAGAVSDRGYFTSAGTVVSSNLYRDASATKALRTVTGYVFFEQNTSNVATNNAFLFASNYQDAQTVDTALVTTNQRTVLSITQEGVATLGPTGFAGPHISNGNIQVRDTLFVLGLDRASRTMFSPLLLGSTDDNISLSYVLLAPAYTVTAKAADGFDGEILEYRGATAGNNACSVHRVVAHSAFDLNRASCFSSRSNTSGRIVTCVYLGTTYIALEIAQGSTRRVSWRGSIYGSMTEPIFALAASVSSVTELGGSLGFQMHNGLTVGPPASSATNLSVRGAASVTHGIVFPAAANLSANANTLDDYEEGTFTPSMDFSGAFVGGTLGTQTGRYVKIGKTVYFWLYVVVTNLGSSTGNWRVTGLPFTASAATEGYGPVSTACNGISVLGGKITGYVDPATNRLLMAYERTDAAAQLALNINQTHFRAPASGTPNFIISGMYFTDS